MHPLHISNGDIQGGAARAAYRIHQCLLEDGHASRMMVRYKAGDDWRVETPTGWMARRLGRLRSPVGKAISTLQRSVPGSPRNSAWLPSRLSPQINAGDSDVVNLHWIAAETISISDLMQVERPLVWTLHDMWAFCGMEHYAEPGPRARWREGYSHANKNRNAGGLDLDGYLWRAKAKLCERQIMLISPSKWLQDCVGQSALFNKTPCKVIGHPINLDVYRPRDQEFCRDALGLPQGARLIVFGAVGGIGDSRKGFDLLQDALWQAFGDTPPKDVHCCVFGQSTPKSPPHLPLPIHWLGRLSDEVAMAMLYSAADIMVVPSRQEAFGLTASEAAACGCPVLAFDNTGVADIVAHGKTGYLARPFESGDLATGLKTLIEDAICRRAMGAAARARAEALWSPKVIAAHYHAAYAEASDSFLNSRKG